MTTEECPEAIFVMSFQVNFLKSLKSKIVFVNHLPECCPVMKFH